MITHLLIAAVCLIPFVWVYLSAYPPTNDPRTWTFPEKETPSFFLRQTRLFFLEKSQLKWGVSLGVHFLFWRMDIHFLHWRLSLGLVPTYQTFNGRVAVSDSFDQSLQAGIEDWRPRR